MLILFLIFITQGISYQCTYIPFGNDATPWGTGPCNTSADCSNIGVCIWKECLCPPERAKPDCSYVRFNKTIPAALSMGLSVVGLGCIGNFMVNLIGYGIGELLFYITGMILLIISFKVKFPGKFYKILFVTIGLIFVFGSVLWSVLTGALILTCNMNDGNGYSFFN